jgi:hypothetical protein
MEDYRDLSFCIIFEGGKLLKSLGKYSKNVGTHVSFVLETDKITCLAKRQDGMVHGMYICADELTSYFTREPHSTITMATKPFNEYLSNACVNTRFKMFKKLGEEEEVIIEITTNNSSPVMHSETLYASVEDDIESHMEEFSENMNNPALKTSTSSLKPIKTGISKSVESVQLNLSMIGILEVIFRGDDDSIEGCFEIRDQLRPCNHAYRMDILGEDLDEINYQEETYLSVYLTKNTCTIFEFMKSVSGDSALVSFIMSNNYSKLLISSRLDSLGEVFVIIGNKPSK